MTTLNVNQVSAKFLANFAVFLALILFQSAFAATIAGIEIGSKGVKARVIEIDDNFRDSSAGGIRYSVLFSKEANPGIIDGASGKLLTDDGIRRGVSAIKELIQDMKSRFDPSFLVVVASTSFDSYDNRGAMETAIRQETGQRLEFITEEEEIYFALRTSVPAKVASAAILIDVGSGNTKIGYSNVLSKSKFDSLRIEFGSEKVATAAKARGGDFEAAVLEVIRSEVRPALRKALDGHAPVLNPRRIVFLEGGAPWVAATFSRPQDVDRNYTEMKIEDVRSARQGLRDGRGQATRMPEKAVREQDQILESPRLGLQWALAGSHLLEAILEETNARGRRIVFNRNSGWIYGYTISSYDISTKSSSR
jgi:hypothetical protein